MTSDNHNKRALILGTTSGQVDLIRHLRDRGWHVTGAGHRKQGAGLRHLDTFVPVDISRPDKVRNVAEKRDVELVCSSGSDLGVSTAARVNQQLGTDYPHNLETIQLCNRKDRLRNRLNEYGVSPVLYRTVNSETELQNWTTYPAVVKPPDRHGQRGVHVVEDESEAKRLLPEVLARSTSGHAMIEEYLDGPEYSVNAVVRAGTVQWCVPTRRTLHEERRGIAAGHVIGPEILPDRRDDVRALVGRVVDLLNIENGPVYLQLRDTNDGLRVLEVAPRLDGCHIWRLIRAATGMDLIDEKIDWLTSSTSSERTAEVDSTYHTAHLFAEPEATFQKDQYRMPTNPLNYEFYYEEGEEIRRVNGTSERVGYYLREGTP